MVLPFMNIIWLGLGTTGITGESVQFTVAEISP